MMPHLDIKAETAKLEAIELENVESVKPIRGVVDFLSLLKGEDWGIFTSAPRKLAIQRLKAASIPVPDVLVTVEDVTNGKPHPEGYVLAASMLGSESNKCLVFEDAEAGILSANKAGCDVIRISAAVPAHHPIGHFNSVEDYFDVSVYLNGRLICSNQTGHSTK